MQVMQVRLFVTQFAKTRHNGTLLEIHNFCITKILCAVVISSPYYEYMLSYMAT